MARSGSTSRPGRSLLGLFVALAVLFGWVTLGAIRSNAEWSPKLGIDLEGGTEVILKPVPTTGNVQPTQAQLREAVNIIRQRVNGSGVSEAQVSTQGNDKIIVQLPGKPDQKTLNLVKQSAELSFRPVLAVAPIQPAVVPTPSAGATPPAGATPAPSGSAGSASPGAAPAQSSIAANPSATKASSRIAPASFLPHDAATTPDDASSGAATPGAASSVAPSVADAGADTGTADTSNSQAAGTNSDLALVNKKTSSIYSKKPTTISDQFTAATCSRDELNQLKTQVSDPKQPLVTCMTDGSAKLILGPVEVKGSEIKSASAGIQTNSQGFSTGEWEVKLNFKSTGTRQFAEVTKRLATLTGAQNQFAIVLDGLVVSDPGVRERIPTGEASITGSFNQDTATTLANQLKFGALPISFEVQSEKGLSALLGSEQLQRGLLAGVIGLILVMLYSLAQYRALGLVTIFSLAFAGTTTYGLVLLLSWQQGFRLSLAGVAGLIVSIGITADSFIVYFERVRDEVREGRPLRSAVEAGWMRARRTILVSDTVNFVAAVVLFILAVGDVRGFAFTLGLTTLVDVFIVFLFTKPAVTLLSRTAFFDGGHALSGFSAEQLGRVPAYAGRGRVRAPAERSGQSIAERRAAAAAAADVAGSPPPDDDLKPPPGNGTGQLRPGSEAGAGAGPAAGSNGGRSRPGTRTGSRRDS